MSKVILMVGPPGSGKSTAAAGWTNAVEANRDDIRINMFLQGNESKYHRYKFGREDEDFVTSTQRSMALHGLKKGQDIIISDTNLTEGSRRYWHKFAADNKCELEEMVFDIPLTTCLERNLRRSRTVPYDIMINMYRKFLWYKGTDLRYKEDGLDRIIVINSELMEIEVVKEYVEYAKSKGIGCKVITHKGLPCDSSLNIYQEELKGKYRVHAVIDTDVHMWKVLKLNTLSFWSGG